MCCLWTFRHAFKRRENRLYFVKVHIPLLYYIQGFFVSFFFFYIFIEFKKINKENQRICMFSFHVTFPLLFLVYTSKNKKKVYLQAQKKMKKM
jgi:hypothetical protein